MNNPPSRPIPRSDDDLQKSLIEDTRLSLFDVYRVRHQKTGQHVVFGVTFRNCTLDGPCVILPVGGTIENCQLGEAAGDARNLTLSPNGAKVIGALVFDKCTFDGCHFVNVGFTGSRPFLDGLVRSSQTIGAVADNRDAV